MIFVYSTFAICGVLAIFFSLQRLLAAALFGVAEMESNLDHDLDSVIKEHTHTGTEIDSVIKPTR